MILGNISFVTLGNKDVHPLEMIWYIRILKKDHFLRVGCNIM
jgi:hypothetical protein